METISEYVLTFLINALWQIAIIAAVAAVASQIMAIARLRIATWCGYPRCSQRCCSRYPVFTNLEPRRRYVS